MADDQTSGVVCPGGLPWRRATRKRRPERRRAQRQRSRSQRPGRSRRPPTVDQQMGGDCCRIIDGGDGLDASTVRWLASELGVGGHDRSLHTSAARTSCSISSSTASREASHVHPTRWRPGGAGASARPQPADGAAGPSRRSASHQRTADQVPTRPGSSNVGLGIFRDAGFPHQQAAECRRLGAVPAMESPRRTPRVSDPRPDRPVADSWPVAPRVPPFSSYPRTGSRTSARWPTTSTVPAGPAPSRIPALG